MSEKIGVILTSHGDMAKGVLNSATMIFGKQEAVDADIFPDGSRPEDLRKSTRTALPALVMMLKFCSCVIFGAVRRLTRQAG